MPEPIDANDRYGSLRKQMAIRDEVKAIMQKQKEDERERKKALSEQIQVLVQKQKEEDEARKKVLQEQIDAILKKQKEEDEARKKSLSEQIALKMDIAREEHITKHHNRTGMFGPDLTDVEVRKGFLKLHILGALMQQPAHGYELIHQIGHHSGHIWRPSPGSMYPALESLEATGFISCQGDGRRKVYSLTPKGEDLIDTIQKKREEQFLEMKAFLTKVFDE